MPEPPGLLRPDVLDMETRARPKNPTPVVLAEEYESGTWSADRCFSPELRITDTLHVARFSPWQIVVGTLTAMYASRNLDKLFGLGGTHIVYIPFLSLIYPSLLVAARRTSPRAPG